MSKTSPLRRSQRHAFTSRDDDPQEMVTSSFDVAEYISDILDIENDVERSSDENEAIHSFDITQKHNDRAKKVVASFVQLLSTIESNEGKKMGTNV